MVPEPSVSHAQLGTLGTSRLAQGNELGELEKDFMFLSKAHCPICKSANVRQSQRHAEGLFRRERYCGGCGIRFRLNFIQSLAHILSTPHPHGPELHQALPSRLSCHVLTPAFSPNSSYYPVQERLKASGVPQEESNDLRLSCAGRTFQFDIKLQRPFALGGKRDSPSTSLNAVRDIARARWSWLDQRTNPSRQQPRSQL